jgi:hypothetical protein
MSFPSSDYWMPLPATGSRSAVLSRRWTPATTVSPQDRWTPTQPPKPTVPVLERHWAAAVVLPVQTTSVPTRQRDEETVTIASRAASPRSIAAAVSQTVTLTVPDSAAATVTRLCIGCGEPLEGKRPQAKAHGAACRQRAYRRRKKEAARAQGQRENGHGSEPEMMGLAATPVGAAPL